MATKIEWCQETWNVTTGCEHCYAARLASGRLKHHRHYKGLSTGDKWTGEVRCNIDILDKPLHWRKPRLIFVSSTGDLFHPSVPDSFIIRVLAVTQAAMHPVHPAIAKASYLPFWGHRFLILTKRPERLLAMSKDKAYGKKIRFIAQQSFGYKYHPATMDFSNLWIGVTAENQEQADKRIPILLQIPAKVWFVSVEPMLGAVDLVNIGESTCGIMREGALRPLLRYDALRGFAQCGGSIEKPQAKLDWVICGGESGPGARPMHPDWARGLRDQCKDAGVPFFFKQWGEWAEFAGNGPLLPHCNNIGVDGTIRIGDYEDDEDVTMGKVGKKAAGRLLDGKEYSEYPAGNVK